MAQAAGAMKGKNDNLCSPFLVPVVPSYSRLIVLCVVLLSRFFIIYLFLFFPFHSFLWIGFGVLRTWPWHLRSAQQHGSVMGERQTNLMQILLCTQLIWTVPIFIPVDFLIYFVGLWIDEAGARTRTNGRDVKSNEWPLPSEQNALDRTELDDYTFDIFIEIVWANIVPMRTVHHPQAKGEVDAEDAWNGLPLPSLCRLNGLIF